MRGRHVLRSVLLTLRNCPEAASMKKRRQRGLLFYFYLASGIQSQQYLLPKIKVLLLGYFMKVRWGSDYMWCGQDSLLRAFFLVLSWIWMTGNGQLIRCCSSLSRGTAVRTFIAAVLQAEAAAFIIEPRKRYSGPTGAFLSMSIQASCAFFANPGSSCLIKLWDFSLFAWADWEKRLDLTIRGTPIISCLFQESSKNSSHSQ